MSALKQPLVKSFKAGSLEDLARQVEIWLGQRWEEGYCEQAVTWMALSAADPIARALACVWPLRRQNIVNDLRFALWELVTNSIVGGRLSNPERAEKLFELARIIDPQVEAKAPPAAPSAPPREEQTDAPRPAP